MKHLWRKAPELAPTSELEKHIVSPSSKDLLYLDVWRLTFSTRDGFTLERPRGPGMSEESQNVSWRR